MTGEEQFAAEFETHRPYLHAIAFRVLGSAADADDAVREAWLRLGAPSAAADSAGRDVVDAFLAAAGRGEERGVACRTRPGGRTLGYRPAGSPGGVTTTSFMAGRPVAEGVLGSTRHLRAAVTSPAALPLDGTSIPIEKHRSYGLITHRIDHYGGVWVMIGQLPATMK